MIVLPALAATVLATLGYVILFIGQRSRSMPPGPPTWPIIGNLHQIPKNRPHLKFNEWASTYGGLYSVKIAWHTFIIITDRRLVKELMDKRSAISSNRPPTRILSDLYEGDNLVTMNHTDPRWRAGRKLIHQHLTKSMVEETHMRVINAEAVQLLRDLRATPEHFLKHLKRFSNSLIMSIGYGVRTPTADAPHMVKSHHVIHCLTRLMQSVPPVDIFPFLGWIPERFMGGWYTRAKEVNHMLDQLYSEFFDVVVQRRGVRGSIDTFADRLIDQQESLGWSRHQLYMMAGLLMEGGSDTTSAAMSTFVHLVAQHPEFAIKAQEQIDAVVGEDRTPVWDDFARLPMVTALIKEALRHRPIAPLAFPHALSEDVWLDGKLLPRGSTLLVNVFGLHHDNGRFANAESFDPLHFANKPALASEYATLGDYESRDHYAYGTGRRLCPGIHLAEHSLFVAISKILWAFNISPGCDDHGKVVNLDSSPTGGYSDAGVISPNPFPCSFLLRSEKRQDVLTREFENAEGEVFPMFQASRY